MSGCEWRIGIENRVANIEFSAGDIVKPVADRERRHFRTEGARGAVEKRAPASARQAWPRSFAWVQVLFHGPQPGTEAIARRHAARVLSDGAGTWNPDALACGGHSGGSRWHTGPCSSLAGAWLLS